MLQFTFNHGSTALQGVGGAIDRAMERQAVIENQKIRAQQAEANMLAEQTALAKQLDKISENERRWQMESEERLATSKLFGPMIRGEVDWESLSPTDVQRTLAGIPVSAQVVALQTAAKARENKARREEEQRKEGRHKSLQGKVKKGVISEEEYTAAALAEAEGDSEPMEALEARTKEEGLKRSRVKSQLRTIDGLSNSVTFMAGMSREQVELMEEARAMFEELAEGNVYADDDYEAAMDKLRQARSDPDLVKELEEARQAVKEQQYMLEQLQIASAGYDPRQALQAPGYSGLTPDAPQSLLPTEFGGTQQADSQNPLQSSFGSPVAKPDGPDTLPSVRALPHREQVQIAKQMDQTLRDIVQESGIDPADFDDELYAETMSQVAREMFNVDLPASQVLGWRRSVNQPLSDEAKAVQQGRPDFLAGTGLEAIVARDLRERARKLTGTAYQLAGKLNVSVGDLLAVADPGSDLNKPTFNDSPEEAAMREADSDKAQRSRNTPLPYFHY